MTTVHLFLVQILCFNTALTHLRLLSKMAVAAPAYWRARMRLPLEVLQKLLRRSATAMSAAVSSPRWCGLRPLLVDGSSAIAPDTPSSQKAFGQPGEQKPGCGFPIPKVLGLFDAATLKMRRVKSQTAEGVRKELAVYALVYNLVHVVMLEASRRQGVTVDRLSFVDTIRWLLSAVPGEEMPNLIANPRRPHRHEPRVIKDLQDTYRKMTKPRCQLRKALKKQAKAA